MFCKVAVREVETRDALSTALLDIAWHIGRWGEYLRLFPEHTRIHDTIATIFAHVLNYVVRARYYFEKPWTGK